MRLSFLNQMLHDRADFIGYHKIHLATKQKELEVRTREGYYADREQVAGNRQ